MSARSMHARPPAARPVGPVCTPALIYASAHWPALQHVPVRLVVQVPVAGLRLCDLQTLRVGTTIESVWSATQEVPLFARGTALGWCEFEGVNQTMAVRLTHVHE